MDIPEALSIDYIERQYELWKKDPESVSKDWRFFFSGFEMADKGKAEAEEFHEAFSTDASCTLDKALLQSRVEALKYRYRDLGHLLACLDPLSSCPTSHPLLELSAFGLSYDDLDTQFYTRRFSQTTSATLKEIINQLKETYCRSVGVEYMHIQDPKERRWLRDRMEPVRNQPEFTPDEKIRIYNKLCQAFFFENFLNKKYPGQTRFSLEGAESLIPMLDALFLRTSDFGCKEIILGMAHRGRLNVLSNVFYKQYEEIFREFINDYDPDSLIGEGDVKYHNGYLTDIKLANGKMLRAFMVNNPSHLESVDPVVEGVARARQDILNDTGKKVLPVLIHGDSAFSGQGVVMETLNLSRLKGYKTGGTIHIIINNQIGYTTLPEHARSTRYSTDIAKMLMIPVFHVHGENPEAIVHVIRLAHDYRMEFGKDVVIDMICYRRYGHNEGDEPYFTQPEMYKRIRERPPVHEIYEKRLMESGDMDESGAGKIKDGLELCLEDAFKNAREKPKIFPNQLYYEIWENFHGNFSHEPIETKISKDKLISIARKINNFPDNFNLHPKLKRLFKKRLLSVEKGTGIDWANAEALAFASLVSQGAFIRLSGQDSPRGTFSQRHLVVVDMESEDSYTPLENICDHGGEVTALNSSLSEAGVLGFEYGYSITRPEGLTIWEAQFGDFANNAQGIIDLYIVSGQAKWQRLSGLVMLLPHGWDGLGPEHSSARLERFLQLCADDNIQVCNLTTPAQYFHVLRRQFLSKWRKPLVIMAPKSLLRHPGAVSDINELAKGCFEEIMDDREEIENPGRVIFLTGKIYYPLYERREALKAYDIAMVRVEQLYPFPQKGLQKIIEKYKNAGEWVWVQEEPENMGAWSFIEPHLRKMTGKDILYIGRKASASPATGFANIYGKEQAGITDKAIGTLSGIKTG